MESWIHVWRNGFMPQLNNEMLETLLLALESDDQRLLQGAVTCPPPMRCVQDWPVEGACALGYCGWQVNGLQTVGQIEEFFARACFATDCHLDEPAACRRFLNWFDNTPRAEMRRRLGNEIKHNLQERKNALCSVINVGDQDSCQLSTNEDLVDAGNATE